MMPVASYDVFNAYSEVLQHHPTMTKATTGVIFCCIADIIAQIRGKVQLNKNNIIDTINYQRLGRFAVKGFFGAIIWGGWYDLSSIVISTDNVVAVSASLGVKDSLLDNDMYTTITRTLSFLIVEQFIACPIVFSLWEIPAATILNNAPIQRIPYEVDDKLGDMLMANAKVWTFANLIIYNIPTQYRVGFSSLLDIFWQTIVSDFAADCGEAKDDIVLDPTLVVTMKSDEEALATNMNSGTTKEEVYTTSTSY